MFTEDCIGKRKMYLVGMLFMSSGMLLMFLSRSMATAVLGQIMYGFFALVLKRFSVALISDIAKPELSEKFIPIMQAGLSLGAVIGPFAYRWIKHWRSVTLYFYFLPLALLFCLSCFFLRDTPRYLLRKHTAAAAAESLNFVAAINSRPPLEEGEVQQVMDEEGRFKEVKEHMNPLDLCRYQSTRIPSIAFCFLICCIDLVGFSHSVITDEIGLNPTLNLILMSGAEIVALTTLNLIVPYIERRLASIVMALAGLTISLVLLLVKVPSNCEGCSLAVLQIGLVLIARFSIAFMTGLYFVAQSEFYPTSVKGVGVGAAAFAGNLGIVLAQIVLTDAKQLGINPFLIIGVCYLMAAVATSGCPKPTGCSLRTKWRKCETHDRHLI